MEKLRTRMIVVSLFLVVGSLAIVYAGDAHQKAVATHDNHIMLTPVAMKWGAAPPVLPAGAKMTVVEGDPGAAGLYTVRLKLPEGYRIMPHWHPTDEHVTVLSGTLNVAMGDKFDPAAGKALGAGGYFLAPAKMVHFAWTTGATEIQIHGVGPFQLTYVNPSDDPSRIAMKSHK